MSAVWRLEYQERGAAHFHLLLINAPYIPRNTLQAWWGDVIGEERPFVDIRFLRNQRQVISYIGKYIAKVRDSEVCLISASYLHAGRWWGVFNGHELPFDTLVKVASHMGLKSYYDLKRAFRRYLKARTGRNIPIGTVFTSDIDKWKRYFEYLVQLRCEIGTWDVCL
jgi:hypothetical protein